MWSAMEEEQFTGRFHRKRQLSWVVVYSLVVVDSPDVFLNNLSFSKVNKHLAFTNAAPAIR